MSKAAALWLKYLARHGNAYNRVLHLIGVPSVAAGLVLIFRQDYFAALLLITLGYILQYIGHRIEGNLMGEVLLLRRIIRR